MHSWLFSNFLSSLHAHHIKFSTTEYFFFNYRTFMVSQSNCIIGSGSHFEYWSQIVPFWIFITNCAILNTDHKLCHFEYSLQIVPFLILFTNCVILNIHHNLCHFEYSSQILTRSTNNTNNLAKFVSIWPRSFKKGHTI